MHIQKYKKRKTEKTENFTNCNLTGLEFKIKYPNYQAVKIIGNNKNNYHYQLGLNTDSIPFTPSGKC
jgi:hypothetical protein